MVIQDTVVLKKEWYMAMLVLFGAGASHGSEPEARNKTPPLGKYLFPELCKLGGISSMLPADIKECFYRDFEEGMAVFNERMNIELQPFHRELSSYLADFTPSLNSYYVEMLKLLHGRNVVFSSLNYDMMLEEAAEKLGIKTNYGLDRILGAVRLIKPHGSINFWPEVPYQSFHNLKVSGFKTTVEAPVRPLTRGESKHRCVADTSFSPAISMYAKGKKVPVCPSYVAEHQSMFAHACRRASQIMIVGVRVVPEDIHIWKPILKSKAKITYFGSGEDQVELDAWGRNSGRKNIRFVEGFFDKAVSEVRNVF